MAQLRFIAVHEDGQHLVLSAADGTELLLPVDERLRAAVRTRGPAVDTPPSQLRPRDVQAMIRAGQTAEEVATVTGWPVARVARFEAPIVAEREHVAGLARGAHVRGRGEGVVPTLESRVHGRLAARGVDLEATTWDATRPEGGTWTVLVSFVAGQRGRSAAWRFEPADRTVEALDDEARWLSEDEQALPGSAAGKELLGSHGVSEEVDLVTSLRERSRTRGRRRRSPGAQPEAGDAATMEPLDEDVLPLEDLAAPPGTNREDATDSVPSDGTDLPAVEATEKTTSEDPTSDDSTQEPDTAGAPGGSPTPVDAPKQSSARSRRRRTAKNRAAAPEGEAPATGDKVSAVPPAAAPEAPTEGTLYDVTLDFDENYEVDPTPQDATLADLFGPGDHGGYPELLDDDLDTDGFDGADVDLPGDTTAGDALGSAPSDEKSEDSGPTGSGPTLSSDAEPESTKSSTAEPENTKSTDTEPESTKSTDTEPESTKSTDTEAEGTGPDSAEPESTEPDTTETGGAGSDATDPGSTPAVSTERPTRRKDGRPGVPSWDDIMFGAKERK